MGYFEEQFGMHVQSKTKESQTAVFGDVRISVLTSRLLRVETMNAAKAFCDQPTQKVWYRDFEQPRFDASQEGQMLTVRTEQAIFHYNLRRKRMESITLRGGRTVTDFESGNLRGTARTLDQSTGSVPLTKGVISKDGVATLDDSASLLLLEDGRITPRQKGGSDLYFFAYGHDYRGCIRDLFRLTGPVPLVPRWCLGNWWSRYKAYSQEEYTTLMQRFIDEKIPITVATIDMDWHWTDVKRRFGKGPARRSSHSSPVDAWFDAMSNGGWTGYSWNTELFPDYRAFLCWLKEQNFHTTLNIHPAGGVRSFEDCYKTMAEAMGIDPASGDPVEFDITDPKFIEAYFQCLHHPYEQEGVDFWWIDWQQGSNCKIEGLDPLWIFNHFHFLDSARNGKRPMTFSRYAGPGSHRYPVGFSGDTHITWDSLDFQPYFTSTASNIGYGWWSHDIGGHMLGYKNDEMTARWTQYGIFSPIMRLHSSCSDFNGKEPWRFKKETEVVMEEALRERHRMMPYLYTMNYRSYQEDLPLVEPMYYEYPEAPEAYEVKNQYFFGDQLMVAAVTTPRVKDLNVAKTAVWLPDGVWYDLYTGLRYEGGRMVDMYRTLDSIPVLAKAGGILVMTDEIRGTEAEKNPESLKIKVFPGADGNFRLYEDDNETCAYENGACVFTEMDYKEKDQAVFTIHPAQGKTELIPAKRAYTVEFCNFAKTGTDTVKVLVNGAETEAAVKYEEKLQKICVEVAADTAAEVQIILAGEVADNQTKERVFDFLNQAEIGFVLKDRLYQLITAGKKLPVLLSELQSMELDKDLYGALMEILTA